jgi:hypothetical protein
MTLEETRQLVLLLSLITMTTIALWLTIGQAMGVDWARAYHTASSISTVTLAAWLFGTAANYKLEQPFVLPFGFNLALVAATSRVGVAADVYRYRTTEKGRHQHLLQMGVRLNFANQEHPRNGSGGNGMALGQEHGTFAWS